MNAGLTARPDKENVVSATKKPWFWYWVPTAVFFIGLSSIALLLWVNRINESARIDALINDAIMDVQIKVSTSHLWLEEAVSGDDTADEAMADMDKAIRLIDVVLNGGESEHGLIPEPLQDPELRSHGEALRSLLVNFKMFARERLQNSENAGIASAIEQRFDTAFKEILGQAGALEEIIKKNDARERTKSGRLFLGILFAWAFIVVATTAGLWSREVRRRSAEEALLKANAQLHAQTDELTGHRERLAELVEMRTAELTNANELLHLEIDERKRMAGEIQTLNEELERKVVERTIQLSETQEELVRGEKLAVLGRLSGSVGHELRNPLGVMSNAVYFLKMVLADADETVKEYLGIIKHEIDNSDRIIADLLDFARTKTPQAREITAGELIAESVGRCAVPDNIRLCTEMPESLPKLSVDPLQMGQVFQNLITNAVQAMPEGGELHIAARHVRAIHESPLQNPKQEAGDAIAISVSDTGEGITPENMKKLFQPLFTTKARGIGLGLVVCRNLVEANGGRITVESRLGEGTSFSVMLPLWKE